MQGYSIKVKKLVELQEPITYKKMKNGTFMFKGKCPESGNTVCSIISEVNSLLLIESGKYSEER